AKEQKKNAAKPAKVVTEDDLPARPAETADATPAAASPAAAAQPSSEAQAPAPNAAPPSEKDAAAKAAGDAEYAKLKSQTEQAQKEIDLLQRNLALDQDNFLSNSDYIHDKAGKAKLEDEREQIAEKLQALDQ